MEISVAPATRSEADVLVALFQLYAHDFSEIMGFEIEDSGRFAHAPLDPYWEDPWRHPRLLRVGGRLAGFALIQQRSRLSGDAGVWDMAEFFVLRRHRRAGVGAACAARLFAQFPGPWEVRERHANVGAIAFWRRVIGQFTGQRFREETIDDERWQGPVQFFHSSPGPPLP